MVSDDLGSFEEHCQVLCRMALGWDLDLFLMCFGRGGRKVKCHCHHRHQGCRVSVQFTPTVDDLDHPAKGVVLRLPRWKALLSSSFPIPFPILCGRKSLCTAYNQSRREDKFLLLRGGGGGRHTLPGTLLHGRSVTSPPSIFPPSHLLTSVGTQRLTS